MGYLHTARCHHGNNASTYVVAWIISGILVVGYCICSSLLSFEFIYGVGHADRPVGTFLLFYASGWVGFALAVLLAVRRSAETRLMSWIITVAIAARFAFLPSNLIQENDCYRYVLDGEAVLHGVNPYRFAPEDVSFDAPEHFRRALNTDRAQQIISRVGYPEIPTIYPPLAQVCFAAGAFLTPWSYMGQRLVFLLFDIATIVVIVKLLKIINRPYTWSVVYAWNPLVLKEVANSAHVDSLVAFTICLLILSTIRWLHNRSLMRTSAVALCLAAAILAKLYPLALLPIYAGVLWRGNGRRQRMTLFVSVLVAIIVAAYAPFLTISLDRVMTGFRIYTEDWIINEGAFSLCHWIAGKIPYHGALPLDRLMSNGVVFMVACFGAIMVMNGKDDVANVIRGLQTTLLIWYLMLPAVFPWYAIALVAVSALRPKPWIVVLSGMASLYYIHFMVIYRDYAEYWWTATRTIEHGGMWLAVVAPAVYHWFVRPLRKQG